MNTGNDGGWAFPHHGGLHPSDDPRNGMIGGGMTLRDYFAAQAMTGWMASMPADIVPLQIGHREAPEIASLAYRIADAMLKERAK